uniref:Uncharacterized protein n=1 Tax=Arundo donax TaxID=35708 RepID=A0A0A9FMT9_ARUDO
MELFRLNVSPNNGIWSS